jgi:hypothetical protein
MDLTLEIGDREQLPSLIRDISRTLLAQTKERPQETPTDGVQPWKKGPSHPDNRSWPQPVRGGRRVRRFSQDWFAEGTGGEDGSDRDRDGWDEEVAVRLAAIDQRVRELETTANHLIDTGQQLLESLRQTQEAERERRGSREREPWIPRPNTRYYEVLQDLVERFGGERFESSQIPLDRRHVVSILKNKYNALEVVDTRGRTQIYTIKKEILEKIYTNLPGSIIVEIWGKGRDICDAFLAAEKNQRGLRWVCTEDTGYKQRYCLALNSTPDRHTADRPQVISDLNKWVGEDARLVIKNP